MLHRPWTLADWAITGPHSRPGESLQADVMRFLAILGFCLMATFALVRAIPASTPPPTPVASTSIDQSPAAEARVERLRRAAEAEPPRRVGSHRHEVEADRSRQPESETDSVIPVSRPPAPATSRGFVLRFASDDALGALIRKDVVSLYAIDETNAWRVRIPGGIPRLVPTPRPRSVHVMEPSTVSATLLALYENRARKTTSTPSPVWGVRLPEPIRRQVADLTRTVPGGTLTIGGDGRVRLASRPAAR